MPKNEAPTEAQAVPSATRKFLGGIEFSVPQPYSPGHALTPGEARFLNSQLGTVAGNAFGGDIRRAGGTIPDDVQALFAAKFDEVYDRIVNGTARAASTGGTSSDPVTSLVSFLAKEAIKAKIKRKGLKVKDFMDTKVEVNGEETSKFMALVAQHIEKEGEALRAQAEAQLANTTAASDDDDLELDSAPVAEAA